MNNDPEMTNETQDKPENKTQTTGDEPVDDPRMSDPNQGDMPADMDGNNESNSQLPEQQVLPQPSEPGQMNEPSKPMAENQPEMVGTASKPDPVDTNPPQIFTREEITDLRSKWKDIQVQFIDSPCSAVEQGDTLVADVLERVKEAITHQQELLNKQWVNNDDVSTEELRVALRSYRMFLDRLLSLGE